MPGDVKPRFKRLWEDALLCERSVINEEDIEFNIDSVAVRALQTNYRVSEAELDMLGIYDEALRSAIVAALIDLSAILDWVQKKTAGAVIDGGSSCSGETD
jgi:hypothetical protein